MSLDTERRRKKTKKKKKKKKKNSTQHSFQQKRQSIVEFQNITMTHPTSANPSTGSVIPRNLTVQKKPKIVSIKLVQPPSTSVISHTTGQTYLTAVPLINKSNPSIIQLHESPSITTPITNSMQDTTTIVPLLDSSINSDSFRVDEFVLSDKENDSVFNNDGHFIWNHKAIMLFFSEYENHMKKKMKYQSKEAMFQALAESFQEKGYINATKNHMKNKFKLLKKKWDNYIKRTIGKNSSGKGMKPLLYENEMIKIFGKSHSGVPSFVAGRDGTIFQEEILQRISQNLPDNENENEQQQEQLTSIQYLPSPVTNSHPSSSRTDSPMDSSNISQSVSTSADSRSITNSSCSSVSNARAKVRVRDGKLALTLQTVKESICTVLQKESDNKQESRTKFLTEIQKCNELQKEQISVQKERNSILQKQLIILEKLAKKIYPTEKELSSDED